MRNRTARPVRAGALQQAARAGLVILACPAVSLAYIDPGTGQVDYLPLTHLLALGAMVVAGVAGAIAAWKYRRAGTAGAWKWATLTGLACAGIAWLWLAPDGADERPVPAPARSGATFNRVILLGMDGLDPDLIEEFIAADRMPHFAQLSSEGTFRRLQTSNPPQSPVAWTCMATGTNPGRHGLFDFIHRDPQTYRPKRSLFRLKVRSPLDPPGAMFARMRREAAFWEVTSDAGIPTTMLRWPGSFPPDPVSGAMLSGLGTPDIHPSLGRYTFYTTSTARDPVPDRVVRVAWDGGGIRTRIPGPLAGTRSLSIPLTIYRGDGSVRLRIGDEAELALGVGEWTDWVPLSFRRTLGSPIPGMVKFQLGAVEPELRLYMTPVEVDPLVPAFPVSQPEDFSAELAGRIGRFHTLGMPEMPEALATRRLTPEAFLEETRRIDGERERMLDEALADFREGLLSIVFDSSDRICHMFWFTRDPEHPLHNTPEASAYGDPIREVYERMDRVLGKVVSHLGNGDLLLVVSDHGFGPYRHRVHLNRWLMDAGYLSLSDDGRRPQVDWNRTRAYAVGFSGLYVNLKRREGQGVVPEGQPYRQLCAELVEALESYVDPSTGLHPVRRAYLASGLYQGPATSDGPDIVVGYNWGFRASAETTILQVPPPARPVTQNRGYWSGDHIVDPDLVPGMLLCNRKLSEPHPRQVDIPVTVLAALGLEGATRMDGRPLF